MNLQEEVKETKPEPELDVTAAVPEPARTPESQADSDLQTHTQDHDQEAPTPLASETEPAQHQKSTDALPQAETSNDDPAGHPSLESNSLTPPDEAESLPTSHITGPAHTR